MKNNKFLSKFFEIWPLIPAAIFLSFFFILVLVSLVAISLTYADVFPTLEPTKAVLNDPHFKDALINTLVFVAIGTPIELLSGIFAAMLVYNSYWGKTFLRSVFVIPFALPGLVIATLLFILFDSQGGFANHLLQGEYWLFPKVIDSDISWRGSKFLALSVSMAGKVWRDMPISMLIILSGLNAIEPQLIDAAKTMGAGFRIRFTKIILPLIFPAITTVLLLRSVEMWKEFIFPFILAGNYPLLGTLIEDLYGFGHEPGEAAVVALVLVLCTVLTLVLIIEITGFIKKKMINPGVQSK